MSNLHAAVCETACKQYGKNRFTISILIASYFIADRPLMYHRKELCTNTKQLHIIFTLIMIFIIFPRVVIRIYLHTIVYIL